MGNSNINKWKNLCRSKRSVSIFTRHREGDRYNGVLLTCHKDLVLLESDNDFVFDGIIALPTQRIKLLRSGRHEKIIDQIYSRFGLLKKMKRLPWLLKAENIKKLIDECYHRKLWPIIETQSNGKNALYIGPITSVEENYFKIFCYDAEGKWEKNYKLTYREVFKIQFFDKYSKYFNRFMKEKPKAGPKDI